MEHGGHSHGSSIAEPPNATVIHEPPPPSYFRHPEHQLLLWTHVGLSILAWCFALPIAVFLSIAKSRYTPLSHVVFSALNAAGLFVGILYNANTPDLYENNVHHKLGWWFSVLAAVYSVMALVRSIIPSTRVGRQQQQQHGFDFPMAHYKPQHTYSWSRDSGVGSSEGFASPTRSLPASPSFEPQSHDVRFEQQQRLQHPQRSDDEPGRHQDADFEEEEEEEEDHFDGEDRGLLGVNHFGRKIRSYAHTVATTRFGKAFSIIYETINRLVLVLGFVLVTTGIVTYGGIFKSWEVFSGLAHFIKGGIFFWYGLLTLGRVMGSFGDFGWSWNMKPTAQMVGRMAANSPSIEFLESFIIFFYGCTNVFLEHLNSSDGSWSAQDLEHVSIAVMFLGGGLCGMLVESKKIRGILNSTVTASSMFSHLSGLEEPKSYGYSLNPMPGLIIMLLGIMMSSHSQESMVSTMLHSQWGTLFVAGSLARGVTYITIYLKPPTSYLPSRPPSEIVTAFCFISGGLIFMCSNVSMVKGMENLELNAMFLFTVLMGLTSFIMAWEIAVLAIKGLAVRKESGGHQRSLSSASTQA